MLGKKALVRWVLENSRREDWTVQGFGFMRMYLTRGDESARVHIWNSALRLPGVSDIHTHPWDFESTVIAGLLGNVRYTEMPGNNRTFTHIKRLIKAGEGAYLQGRGLQVRLEEQVIQWCAVGDEYQQAHHEVHRSTIGRDNTITLVTRKVRVANPDHAFVYVPRDESWGNAAPRPATVQEWHSVVGGALEQLQRRAA